MHKLHKAKLCAKKMILLNVDVWIAEIAEKLKDKKRAEKLA